MLFRSPAIVLIYVKWRIVRENAVSRPFEILELPAAQRPPEHGPGGEDQGHREWNQQVKRFHESYKT